MVKGIEFAPQELQWRIQDGIPQGQTEDEVLAPLGKLKNGAPRWWWGGAQSDSL